MSDTFIGIDPGLSGAVAVIRYQEVLEVHDLPVLTMLKTTKTKSGKFKKNNELDIEEFFLMYKGILRSWRPKLVVIEAVHAMPGQGTVSMFNFGKVMGRIEGVIRTTGGTPLVYVEPSIWKKHHKLIKKGKDASVALCRLHYPSMTSTFMKSKDGRAEAVLLAEWGRYTYNANM